MAYADYEFYQNTYHGVVIGSESDFLRLAERASDYMDYITQGRVAALALEKKVQKACCALADKYIQIEKAEISAASDNGAVSSESVGSYSVSYKSGAEEIAEAKNGLYSTAAFYLSSLGLMGRTRGCVRCTLPTP